MKYKKNEFGITAVILEKDDWLIPLDEKAIKPIKSKNNIIFPMDRFFKKEPDYLTITKSVINNI